MLDTGPHRFGEVHELAVDSEGSWYGGDNVLGRTQKFVPRREGRRSGSRIAETLERR